jgi:hypothetical protein
VTAAFRVSSLPLLSAPKLLAELTVSILGMLQLSFQIFALKL